MLVINQIIFFRRSFKMKKKNLLAVSLVLVIVVLMSIMPAYAAAPTVDGKYLDDFERADFLGSSIALADGTTIYWNGAGANSLSITDGILNANMENGGYIRWATNNDKSYKYVVIRIKGDSNAVNDKIYTRIGVAEKGMIDDGSKAEKALSKLLGPDGNPVPAITDQFQDIVIDLAANGLELGGGSDAFQLGTWTAMGLNIDYVFMTDTNPNAAAPAADTTTTVVANPKTGDSTPILPIVAVVFVSATLLVVLSRKKRVEC
jgi:LPXTG-motif cell wall-anchored protein